MPASYLDNEPAFRLAFTIFDSSIALLNHSIFLSRWVDGSTLED